MTTQSRAWIPATLITAFAAYLLSCYVMESKNMGKLEKGSIVRVFTNTPGAPEDGEAAIVTKLHDDDRINAYVFPEYGEAVFIVGVSRRENYADRDAHEPYWDWQ